MKPTQRLTWLAAAVMLWIAAAILLALAGCGPGVGGTGTGTTAFPPSSFGAMADSVCTSPIASQLSCGQTGAIPGPLDSGTATLHWADAAGRLRLRTSGHTAELDAVCAGFVFNGDWGSGAGPARWYGSLQLSTATAPQAASLSVLPAAGGGLTLQLNDRDGRVLLATTTVQRVSTWPAADCR